jgi:predicted DNA-binding transcriptional regulator AlpA
MPEDISKYMKPRQAAAYLQVSTSALAKKRIYGDGPKFVRWGRAIRYRREDLDTYMAARLVRSTSEWPSSATETSAAHARPKGDGR